MHPSLGLHTLLDDLHEDLNDSAHARDAGGRVRQDSAAAD